MTDTHPRLVMEDINIYYHKYISEFLESKLDELYQYMQRETPDDMEIINKQLLRLGLHAMLTGAKLEMFNHD
jgi:hypothetical protein